VGDHLTHTLDERLVRGPDVRQRRVPVMGVLSGHGPGAVDWSPRGDVRTGKP